MPAHDVFISYRRSDGARAARRLRERLLRYSLPEGIRGLGRPLSVYLDEVYEHATEDFFEDTIKPALRRSSSMIVVQTPDAAEARTDGTENWVAREIRYFRSLPDRRRLWVAIARGGFDDPLPADIDAEMPHLERVDIRGLDRTIGYLSEHELIKFIGPLHGVPNERMPELRREEERRRQRLRVRLAAIATSVFATIVAFAVSAFVAWGTAELEASRQKSIRLAIQAVTTPSGEQDSALLTAAAAAREAPTPQSLHALTDLLSRHAKLVRFLHCPIGQQSTGVAFARSQRVLALACANTVLGWDADSNEYVFEAADLNDPRHIEALVGGQFVASERDALLLISPTGQVTRVGTPHQLISEIDVSSKRSELRTRDTSGLEVGWRLDAKQGLVQVPSDSVLPASHPIGAPNQCYGAEPVRRSSERLVDRSDLGVLAFATTNNEVAASVDGRCHMLPGHTHNLMDLEVVESQGDLLLVSAGQIGRERHGAVVWDLRSPHPLATRLASFDGFQGSVSISADGSLIVAHWGGALRTIDLSGGTSPSTQQFPSAVRELGIAPDLSEVVVQTLGHGIRRFRLIDGVLEQALDEVAARAEGFAFSREGSLLLLGRDHVVRSGGDLEAVVPFEIPPAESCSGLRPNLGEVMLSGEDAIELFDPVSRERSRFNVKRAPDGSPRSCNRAGRLGPDHLFRLIQTYGRDPMELIERESGEVRFFQNPFVRESGLPTDLDDFVAGEAGKQVLVLSRVETERVLAFDVRTGRILTELRAGRFYDIDVDASGLRLVTVGTEGLLLWDLRPERWPELAEQLAGRPLSASERRDFDL